MHLSTWRHSALVVVLILSGCQENTEHDSQEAASDLDSVVTFSFDHQRTTNVFFGRAELVASRSSDLNDSVGVLINKSLFPSCDFNNPGKCSVEFITLDQYLRERFPKTDQCHDSDVCSSTLQRTMLNPRRSSQNLARSAIPTACTVSYIGNKLLLTAGHCAGNIKNSIIIFGLYESGGATKKLSDLQVCYGDRINEVVYGRDDSLPSDESKARPILVSGNHADWAIVSIRRPECLKGLSPIPVAQTTSDVTIGNVVSRVSHPYHLTQTIDSGTVLSRAGMGFISRMHTINGQSGAPVLQNGKIVGIFSDGPGYRELFERKRPDLSCVIENVCCPLGVSDLECLKTRYCGIGAYSTMADAFRPCYELLASKAGSAAATSDVCPTFASTL